MSIHDEIKTLYASGPATYPELVKGLIGLGIQSYTVDVATVTILYRAAEGVIELAPGKSIEPIAEKFDRELTLQAVRNTQQGKTDYASFMKEIAAAGVRFYEATLAGPNKRVTYIGSGGSYEEAIPS